MIKCNVTVCGTVGRDATTRTGKEEKTYLCFPLRVALPSQGGQQAAVEIGVSRESDREATSDYRHGLRVEVMGTMYLKRRGEKLYFNLFADEIRPATAEAEDAIRGEILFRGKVGQHIAEKRDKNDQPYMVFSAFSAEKVDEGFEYQWVRFLCFGQEREAWLQPGVRVEAKGVLALAAYNGKPDISCRTEELAPCPADALHSNP